MNRGLLNSTDIRAFFGKMKSFRVFSLLFFAALAAAAQTGTNSVATRAMSLQDCIQQALQHNLDVQIQRYNPQISLYDLHAAYGGYDPTFNISGQHSYNVSPAVSVRFDQSHSTYSIRREFIQFRPQRRHCRGGLQYDFSGNVCGARMDTMRLPFENSCGSIGVHADAAVAEKFLD